MYMTKYFGQIGAEKIYERFGKQKKDIFMFILINMINRLYRYSEQAFSMFDYTGKGYVEARDIYTSKLLYVLPFTRPELKQFLEKDSPFAKKQKMSLELFDKYFYPKINKFKPTFDLLKS